MRVPVFQTLCLMVILTILSGSYPTAVAQSELPPSLYIEAYPDRTSVAAKEDLAFHTSTTAAEYSLEIARIGAKREVVFQKSGIPGGGAHPIPEHASANGCGWPISFSMPPLQLVSRERASSSSWVAHRSSPASPRSLRSLVGFDGWAPTFPGACRSSSRA